MKVIWIHWLISSYFWFLKVVHAISICNSIFLAVIKMSWKPTYLTNYVMQDSILLTLKWRHWKERGDKILRDSIHLINFRSSRPDCKKGVLKNFSKFSWKIMPQILFFNKVNCNFNGKSTLAHVFSFFRTLPDDCFCNLDNDSRDEQNIKKSC